MEIKAKYEIRESFSYQTLCWVDDKKEALFLMENKYWNVNVTLYNHVACRVEISF